MEAPTSPDPIMLRTPEPGQQVVALNQETALPTSAPTGGQSFSVVLPHLPAEDKEKYADLKLNVLEIAGEFEDGQHSYYYALLGDRKYHKVRVFGLKLCLFLPTRHSYGWKC